MHMLTGKWKITAHTPLGEMDLVADFAASEDAATFTGSLQPHGRVCPTYPFSVQHSISLRYSENTD